MMLSSTHRNLVHALIVSLAIHVVLLLGVVVSSPVPLAVSNTTINVLMNRDVRPVAQVQTPPSIVTRPLAAAAKPPSRQTRKTPERAVIAVEQATEAPAIPASVPSAPQEVDASTPAAPVAETKSGTVSAPASAPAHEDVSANISANEIAELRFSLGKAAKRFKRYPPLARERGWEGTAEVALIFSVRSSAPDVDLLHSSGRTILDEQALEMVTQAARATVLPAELKGRDFRITLPVKFSLEDG